MLQRSRPLSNLLQVLKAQAGAALADDATIQNEVKAARALLANVSVQSERALRRLEETDLELQQKWAQLAALLGDVKRLETQRAEALEVARSFQRAMREQNEDDEVFEDTASMPVPMPIARAVAPWRVSSS